MPVRAPMKTNGVDLVVLVLLRRFKRPRDLVGRQIDDAPVALLSVGGCGRAGRLVHPHSTALIDKMRQRGELAVDGRGLVQPHFGGGQLPFAGVNAGCDKRYFL